MRAELTGALSALEGDFQDITGYDVIPPGTYWTVVEDVTLTLHSSGSPRITWRLRILGPDRYGGQLRRDLTIRPDSLKWLKRDLCLCGLELKSLEDLPHYLDNLLNLKLLVRRHPNSVHILGCDSGIKDNGHLFLHLVDEEGVEYLDQTLMQRQYPPDQEEFEAVVDYFVGRYQCPRPYRAYLEDSRSGKIMFSLGSPSNNSVAD